MAEIDKEAARTRLRLLATARQRAAGPRSGGERYDSAMQKIEDVKSRTPEQMYGKLGTQDSGATWSGKQDFLDSFIGGLGDEAKAVGSSIKAGAMPWVSEEYDQAKAANQSARSRFGQENPGTALATGLGGALASGVVTGRALPMATGMQRVGSGMAMGAGYGAAAAEGGAMDRLKGAGYGAGIGLGTSLGVEGLARVVRPNINADSQAMMNRGITPTPGQVSGGWVKALEEKMTSLPIVGDSIKAGQRRALNQFNVALYDDILAPVGIQAPRTPGRDAVAYVNRQLSDQFDNLLPQMEVRIDPQFGQGFLAVRNAADQLPPTELNRFTRFVQDKLAPAFANNGVADGQTMRTLRTAIQAEAAKFSKSTDAYQQELGTIFGDLLETMDDAIARSNAGRTVNINGVDVDLGQRYSDLRLAWAKKLRLENAAGMQGAEQGVITPSHLSSAVKSTDRSLRKGDFARGDALLQGLSDPAKAVLSNKYPDSGTAGRLASMLTGGGMVGLGMVDPVSLGVGLAGAGAASLPYTPAGQRLAAYLLTQRPAAATPIANMLRLSGPAATAGAISSRR